MKTQLILIFFSKLHHEKLDTGNL